MKHLMLTTVTILATLSAMDTQATKPKEMNIRQNIDNGSLNKVIDARLRGLLAGSGSNESGNPPSDQGGCTTQIGNQDNNQSLAGSDQEIIIIGDIINFCR